MTERPVITPALDCELAQRIARYKRTFDADVAAVKRGLAQWLDAHPSNRTATPIALLETAIDRTLAERTTEVSDLAAAADVTDMIQAVLRRAVHKRRATLQMKAAAIIRAAVVLGFEQQLDLHGEEDAKDLIDRAFRRVVKERRGPLQ